jgi:PAS domain S-box-containing protein
MAINRDITEQIKDLLKDHPEGISITDIVKAVPVNRNTASRYLDTLLVTGQVEMRHFGMAKLYSLTRRLPVSSVLSISSEFVMQIDHNLRVSFINTPFLGLLEITEKDVIGKKIDYTRIPAIFDTEYPLLLRWISEGLSGVERSGEIRLAAKHRILSCRVIPVVFPDGQKGVSALCEDITVRRLNEDRIRESEERYRKLVEISPDAIILHRSGTVFYANPAAIRLLGASRADEILGRNILDHVLPEYQAEVRRNIRNDLKGETTPVMEMELLRVDGVPVTVEGRGVRAFIDGEPAVQVAMRDITERKHAEGQLRENERKYRTLIETTGTGYVILDDQGRVLDANPEYVHLTGHKNLEEIRNRQVIEWTTENEREMNAGAVRQCLQDGFIRNLEIDYEDTAGNITPVEINATVIQNEKSLQILTLCRDIKERKLADIALKKSEAHLRSIIRAAPAGIGLVVHRIIREVNDQLCEMTGYSAEELIGQSARMLYLSTDDFDYVGLVKYNQISESGTGSVETRWRRKDGSVINVLLSSSPLNTDNISAGVTFTAMDISRQKQTEEDLRKRERQYRFIVENSLDIINIQSPANILTYVSPSVTSLLGYAQSDVLGKPMLDLVHPDDIGRVRQDIVSIATQGLTSVTSTVRFRHKDGRYLWFESTTNIIRDEKTGQIREFLSISRDITGRNVQDTGDAG